MVCFPPSLLVSFCLSVIRGHQAAVLCVHFNDTKLVSGSCDKTIKVSTCVLTMYTCRVHVIHVLYTLFAQLNNYQVKRFCQNIHKYNSIHAVVVYPSDVE